ncbi:MAG: hypothetical protein ACLU4N_04605 [Butyricimonas faecihominis]
MQEILLRARNISLACPVKIMTNGSIDREVYADYRKQMRLEDCITANDLEDFLMYHTGMEKKDEVFEFVLSHF